MDDLISRQAAIKAIPKRKEGLGGESWMMTYRRSGYNDCIDTCLDAIQQLPSAQPEITETQVKEYCEKRCLVMLTSDAFYRLKSAQPERMKGKWLNKDRRICCSVCGRINFCKPNFCDECGADMREEENE